MGNTGLALAACEGEWSPDPLTVPVALGIMKLKARWPLCGAEQAEVAEWQTRRSQKPLGVKSRVGSNPTFGIPLTAV